MLQFENNFLIPSPLQQLKICDDVLVDIKRDDLIHPEISGNKWRKLKYNLLKAQQSGCDTLITFGGPFSNHIAATASIGKLSGMKTIGVIRGENPDLKNATLSNAIENGMKIIPVPITEFNERYNYNYHDQLRLEFPSAHIINEGGANYEGLMGTSEILHEVQTDYDFIACSCGTGTTAAGFLMSKPQQTKVLAFGVFKTNDGIKEMIADKLNLVYNDKSTTIDVLTDLEIISAMPGLEYAKVNEELKVYVQEFYKRTNVPLDLVYTGKMVFALEKLLKSGYFPSGSRILIYHSGGLQGNKGFNFQF